MDYDKNKIKQFDPYNENFENPDFSDHIITEMFDKDQAYDQSKIKAYN